MSVRYKDIVDSLLQTIFEIDCEGDIQFIKRFGLISFGYSNEDFKAAAEKRKPVYKGR